MQDDRIEKMLNCLADETAENTSSGLAEKIKNRIPRSLDAHKGGLNTFRIIIDLRVGKLAAAAVIILTVILIAGFFSASENPNDGLLQDSAVLVKYIFGTHQKQTDKMLENIYDSSEYFQDGREVVYYGIHDSEDPNSLVMHWEISEDQYRVIYSDWRSEVINAEKLIQLQANMLKKQAGRDDL